MNFFQSSKKNKIISLIIFVAIFFAIFFINNKTPIYSDDWAFYVSYQNQRIQSVNDVFSSIKYFYLHVNGRSVANLIVVLFAFLGKNIFNFFNTLMFILLGWEIYFFASDGKKIKPLGLLAVFILLWFLSPSPNQTLFWMCGAVVYLWMAVLTLLFLIPFRGFFLKNKKFIKDNQLGVFLMFVLGILVGNSHEIIVPAVFLVILFAGYILFKKRKKISKWAISGFIGFMIGAIIQFFAPGNYVKLNHTLGSKGFFQLSSGFHRVLEKISAYQIVLWEIVGVIVFLYVINKIYFKFRKKIMDSFMLLLIIVAFFLDVLGIFFPYFPPRAFFFSNVALIIFISRFLLNNEFKLVKTLGIIILIPAFILSMETSMNKANILYKQYQKRDESILKQKFQGKQNITVKKIKRVKNKILLNEPLLPHSKNVWASRFYGVDSIKLN